MESRIIPITMRDDTISQVDDFKKRTHALSRSDAIRRAVELSDALAKAAGHGDKIIIESKNGKKQVIIPGLVEDEQR